jgi:glycosyltransferase involved in cell wall biosynthesis
MFIEKTRPWDIVEAIEQLHAQSLNVHLLMVGEGVLRPGLEDYVRKKRLPVTFTGFLNQNEIPMGYACSDVLVLPSGYAETWGLVVNEAMACGLPAVVSDRVGCGPDLVVEESTGSIFPVGNVQLLAMALARYVSDGPQLAEHGRKAAQKVAAYSIKAAADNTINALQSIENGNVIQVQDPSVTIDSRPRTARTVQGQKLPKGITNTGLQKRM